MLSDLLGKKIGRLTVERYNGVRITKGGARKTRWLCKCDCGKFTTCDTQSLRESRTRSCGCLARDIRERINKTHGMTRTKEYRAWLHAKDRCYRPNDPRYKTYGALGITMCDEWRNEFARFFADMGKSPAGSTLERINNNEGYKPGNCTWASRLQQANNKRTNSFVVVGGKRMTLAECARRHQVKYKSLHHFYHTRRNSICDAIMYATATP